MRTIRRPDSAPSTEDLPAVPDYEDEILRSLRRIIRAVDLYSHKLMSRHGLSGPQLLCLRQLSRSGPVSSGALAEAMSLSPATVSGILDRLEARELLQRERQVEDKRKVVVGLTEEGRALAAQAPPPLQDSFVLKLRALPDEEQAEICRNLKKLVAMMAAGDLDAAPLLAAGDPVEPPPRRRRRRQPME